MVAMDLVDKVVVEVGLVTAGLGEEMGEVDLAEEETEVVEVDLVEGEGDLVEGEVDFGVMVHYHA